MKIPVIAACGLLFAVAAGAIVGTSPRVAEPGERDFTADSFKIDPIHTTMLFKVRHLGVSNFHGRVNNVRGSFTFDPENPEASTVHVFAEVKDFDTGVQNRDKHIKSPDFFNAREFPQISFQSTRLNLIAEDMWQVVGDLTIHGVTKEITARIENLAAANTQMGYRSGFETTFTVKRSDFGMDLYVDSGMLGDEVEITVSVEGVRE